ncbi:MAG TPA: anaerobic ribonucleoside-triphosphate reductase activating protein [Methanomassiliicoccales archaeon]|nr:anaerobic ribonucleoside-triphosphate reductase activating protein [Methanomassiliicoccales archaeon]
MMRIVGFVNTSLVDWDGRVSSVIFLPGCNFRCPFCHNRELVLSPGSVPEVDHDSMMLYLEENSDFLDGVVITGGEPTIHSDLPDLITDLSSIGLRVKLDTNGSNPSMLLDLIDSGLVESVAMDIKGPLDERYDDICGVKAPLENIKRSISILMDSEIEHEFRTTIVPHLIKEGEVESIAAFIGGARKYALQQFRPGVTLDDRLSKIDPYPTERIRNMAELAKQYVRRVVIRGEI